MRDAGAPVEVSVKQQWQLDAEADADTVLMFAACRADTIPAGPRRRFNEQVTYAGALGLRAAVAMLTRREPHATRAPEYAMEAAKRALRAVPGLRGDA